MDERREAYSGPIGNLPDKSAGRTRRELARSSDLEQAQVVLDRIIAFKQQYPEVKLVYGHDFPEGELRAVQAAQKRVEAPSSVLERSGDWPDLFGSPLLASAGLDRLTHRAHMVVIIGTSFRAHGTHDPGKEVAVESKS
jgi:hypothetical protein